MMNYPTPTVKTKENFRFAKKNSIAFCLCGAYQEVN